VLSLTNAPTSLYTFEDFTVSAVAASTTISFTSSGGGSVWQLDDVSVTAVPAPALSPLGPALVGLSFSRAGRTGAAKHSKLCEKGAPAARNGRASGPLAGPWNRIDVI
jgi:hypothetical protein